MKKASVIKGIGKRRLVKPEPAPVQDAVIKGKFTSSARNDLIPAHIWEQLQDCGEVAVKRLEQLLQSQRFDSLRSSDQLNLIRLALEYAFGKPESAPKREIKVKLSDASSDAVSAAMERLAGVAALPEHKSRDITPDEPE